MSNPQTLMSLRVTTGEDGSVGDRSSGIAGYSSVPKEPACLEEEKIWFGNGDCTQGVHPSLLRTPSASHHSHHLTFRDVRGGKSPLEKVGKKVVSSKFS